MRRRAGTRAAVVTAVVATVAAVLAAVPAVAVAAPGTPTTSATGSPSVSVSPPVSPASPGATTSTTSATPTPASKGIPATFTARLDALRATATTLQADLATSQSAASTAIATYTATTLQVQKALAAAAAAQTSLAAATTALTAARAEVQQVAHDTYVEGAPHTSAALLLTTNPDDLDFTVAALGYLADQSTDAYSHYRTLEAAAQSSVATQRSSLARAQTLQATADTQRVTALTALAAAQTQQGTFAAAVATLRDDAAKAAAAAPLSPADTAAYATFLRELGTLVTGIAASTSATTYVDGGPGLAPLPGTAWVKPLLHYTISSCYCARWGTFHHGVDLAAPAGTPIYAVGAGTVVAAGPAQGFGNWVVVDHHDGSFSIYGHMRVLATVIGTQVRPGTLLAYVGDEGESTGYHLHFEVRIGSYASPSDSTDPTIWLARRGVTL